MRLLLLKMLLPLICFNLAGGFSYAASALSDPAGSVLTSTVETIIKKQEINPLLAVSQILKEADENPILKDLLVPEDPKTENYTYRFSPDKGFSLQYYLSYYHHFIKVRLPQARLLACVFII
jgi:hypothetical protein